jgi:hypothetical protein
LVAAAVRAAALFAAGKGTAGVISSQAAVWAEGALRAMLWTNVKVGAAVVLAAVLVGTGGVFSYRTRAVAGPTQADPPSARGTAAAGADSDKLKLLLDRQENELAALRDRLAVLQVTLRARDDQLKAMTDQVERLTRALADTKQPRDVAGPPPAADRVAQLEQARDEVELLEAQLAVKKAQLKAAAIGRQAARNRLRMNEAGGAAVPLWERAKSEEELAAAEAQLEIKSAEVKEPEVRLDQARRRLARLEKSAAPQPDGRHQHLEQRQQELEKKLEALRREAEQLRRELQPPKHGRP